MILIEKLLGILQGVLVIAHMAAQGRFHKFTVFGMVW